MKQNILRFCISITLIAISFSAMAQDTVETIDSPIESTTDTIAKKQQYYALRLGVDISKPIISLFNDDLKALEVVGDFRIRKNIYIATEIGATDRTDSEDFFMYNTKGAFIKVGGNYNLYRNWLDMNNEIFFGVRYGYSSFSQTLNEYTPNYYGTYFEVPTYTSNIEIDGLTAHWAEFVIGLKVEMFHNFYMGASIAMKKLISEQEPDNFKNLYIPGYGRVYLNNAGLSFNYTVSYTIPFSKQAK